MLLCESEAGYSLTACLCLSVLLLLLLRMVVLEANNMLQMGFCHEEYSNTNDYKLPLTYMVPPHITSENEAGPFNFEVIIDNKFGVAKNNWIVSFIYI